MKITFEFISTKDQLPPTSGTYLTISTSGVTITPLQFSKKHQAFNAHDEFDTTPFTIKVAYWATIPKKLEDVMSKLWEVMEDD